MIELEPECEPEPEPTADEVTYEIPTPVAHETPAPIIYETLASVTSETPALEPVEDVEVDPVMGDIWGRLGSKKSKKKWKGKRAQALDSPLPEASP